jgi:uncharacterized protein (DUF362 family)
VLDGVVAGEGEGPLAPSDRPLGVVLASTDPIALDLAAIRIMGFDETRIPKVWETMHSDGLRLGPVRSPADVEVREATPRAACARRLALDDLGSEEPFVAHPGWRGHLERDPRAAPPDPPGRTEEGEAVPCAG